jgi:hypothetical protein
LDKNVNQNNGFFLIDLIKMSLKFHDFSTAIGVAFFGALRKKRGQKKSPTADNTINVTMLSAVGLFILFRTQIRFEDPGFFISFSYERDILTQSKLSFFYSGPKILITLFQTRGRLGVVLCEVRVAFGSSSRQRRTSCMLTKQGHPNF